MAEDTKVQYLIEINKAGDGARQAKADLESVKQSGKALGSEMDALKGRFSALFTVAAATAGIKASVAAFLDAEKAVAKLNAALVATGQYSSGLSQRLQGVAGNLAGASPFDDENITDVIAKLIAFGAHTQDIDRLTQAIVDLAVLMGKDLPGATQAMIRALDGDYSAFSRLGIKIEETGNATADFNTVLQDVERIAGGQAAAAMETLGGQVDLTTKRLDDLKKAFGGIITSGIGPFNDKLNEGIERLAQFLTAHRKVLGELAVGGAPGWLWRRGAEMITGKSGKSTGSGGGDAGMFLNPAMMAALMQPTPKAQVKPPNADENEWEQALARWETLKAANEDWGKESLEGLAALKQAESARVIQLIRDAQERAGTEIDLRNEITMATLEGTDRERATLQINHEEKLRRIGQLKFDTQEQYDAMIALEDQLYGIQSRRFEQSLTFAGRMSADMKALGQETMVLFSSGLSGAIVGAFEEGEKAFQKFAANFFRTVADMILQMIILNALKAGAKALGYAGGGQAGYVGDVNIGSDIPNYAANGIAGVSEVSRATYFPRFNVIAGEAGREVLTVLSKPRLMDLGGITAQVGRAGSETLAITRAGDLAARGGAGGTTRIIVEMQPGLRGAIVEEAAGVSVKIVTRDLSQDSRISRGVRKLVV